MKKYSTVSDFSAFSWDQGCTLFENKAIKRVCFHYKRKYYFVKLQQLPRVIVQHNRVRECTDLYTKSLY